MMIDDEDDFDFDGDDEVMHLLCNAWPNCDMFPENCSVANPGREREYFGHKD